MTLLSFWDGVHVAERTGTMMAACTFKYFFLFFRWLDKVKDSVVMDLFIAKEKTARHLKDVFLFLYL